MTPARHWMRCGEEEQVKFIEDNATACDSSPLNQYQRRF
ncbi:respiratory nitrate reductase 2 subunit delta [Escherichia coli]|uniref:Respiratory nitrate reductase 2 subunit delta n=1 Tax=Escherichia coli TaxID=562 RepID=A0A376VIX1_ECOLX|nr:respiratory nitrate reductase 2 subunit delta [Escherichia coli]